MLLQRQSKALTRMRSWISMPAVSSSIARALQRGRKRHLLVDTEGLVLKVKVHSAKVPDRDGLRLLLEGARTEVSSLKRLWLDAG